MTTLTQPLTDEHRELFPQVEHIREVAECLDGAPNCDPHQTIDGVYDFLAYHLIPHAQAEDAALYPAVQKALGSAGATATMSRDHVEVGRYIDELKTYKTRLAERPLTAVEIKELRRVLYGTYALLKVHFAKEEEVYLPILEKQLTAKSARELFEKMEGAAHQAKQALAV